MSHTLTHKETFQEKKNTLESIFQCFLFLYFRFLHNFHVAGIYNLPNGFGLSSESKFQTHAAIDLLWKIVKIYQSVRQQHFGYVIHLNPLNTKTSLVSRRDVPYILAKSSVRYGWYLLVDLYANPIKLLLLCLIIARTCIAE